EVRGSRSPDCERTTGVRGLTRSAERRRPADLAATTSRTGQRIDLIEQRLALVDQMIRLLLVDVLAFELGSLEQRDHLARQSIALVRDRSELVLELCVVAVVGGVAAFERIRRDRERREPELTDSGVELLVHPSKRPEAAALLGRGRDCPAVEVLDERTSIVRVVVLQSEKGHHSRADVGVIGPRRPVDAVYRHALADPTKPPLD